jgi:hypothetical protein
MYTSRRLSTVEEGFSSVIDFKVHQSSDGGLNFALVGTTTQTSILISDLQPGSQYQFYVVARNIYGLSQPSTTISLTCGSEPDAPTSVSTEFMESGDV